MDQASAQKRQTRSSTKLAEDYQREFGAILRLMRKSRPRRVPSRGRKDYDFKSQAELAEDLNEVWERKRNERRTFDASFVSEVENGQKPLDRFLVDCFIEAIGAINGEQALMLEAAGYHGMAWWMTNLLKTDVSVQVCIERAVAGRLTLEEAATLLMMTMSTALREAAKTIGEPLRPPGHHI